MQSIFKETAIKQKCYRGANICHRWNVCFCFFFEVIFCFYFPWYQSSQLHTTIEWCMFFVSSMFLSISDLKVVLMIFWAFCLKCGLQMWVLLGVSYLFLFCRVQYLNYYFFFFWTSFLLAREPTTRHKPLTSLFELELFVERDSASIRICDITETDLFFLSIEIEERLKSISQHFDGVDLISFSVHCLVLTVCTIKYVSNDKLEERLHEYISS